jgi:hypothetical protein
MAPGAGSNQPVPTPRLPATEPDPTPNTVLPSQVDRRRALVVHPRGEVDVAVLTVHGCLTAALDLLRDTLLVALADDPQAVLCDLSGTGGEAQTKTLAQVAAFGAYPRDWPPVPVVLAVPDEPMRAGLNSQPLSRYLVVRGSVQEALSALTPGPRPPTTSLRLAPHPTAGRAARIFVARSCLDWSMRQGLAGACLVAGELVSNVIVRTRTHVDVTLTRHENRLRLSVRDHDSHPARSDDPDPERVRRRYVLVEGFSRAWGIVPAPDGGRLVWAVLET